MNPCSVKPVESQLSTVTIRLWVLILIFVITVQHYLSVNRQVRPNLEISTEVLFMSTEKITTKKFTLFTFDIHASQKFALS